MAIAHVVFTGLPVTDQARALAFYTGKVGLSEARNDPYAGDERWIELGVGTGPTRILLEKVDDVPGDQKPALVLACDDVGAEAHRLKLAGIAVIQEPTTAPWKPDELYALFTDSEGNTVMLSQRPA